MVRKHVIVMTVAASAALMTACEDVGTEQAPSFEQTQAPAPAPTPETGRSGGYSSGSTLGAAKRAAQNTADSLEQRQKELAEQMNRQLEGDGN